jgi:long-chain acyl-CoA synthetase
MTNLVRSVAGTVDAHPDQPGIAFRGQTVSYEAFWRRAGRLAQALADAGVEPGDRVGVSLPDLPQFLTSDYGVLRAGGVVVPMNVGRRNVIMRPENVPAGARSPF